MHLRLHVFLIILLIVIYPFSQVLPQDKGFKLYPGEELIYKVKWTFFNLGKLKLQLFENPSKENGGIYYGRIFVDSNPLLFFINMHSIFETYLDNNYKPTLHQAYENIDNVNYFTQHYFNYEDSTIFLKMTSVEDTTKIIHKEIPMVEKCYDALGLVHHTRYMADSIKTDTLNTFFGEEIGKVAINYHGIQDKIFSEYADQYDKMYYVDGNIMMKGIAGLTGPYKGWFVGSERRIPVKAALKVFLGSVTLKLDSVNTVADMSYDEDKYKKE